MGFDGFNGDLMGFNGDFMGFSGDLMGFNGDLMGVLMTFSVAVLMAFGDLTEI